MENIDSILSYPCNFPIKAMGKAENEFDSLVVELVRRHYPDILEGAVKTRLSNGGNYMSVTVIISAKVVASWIGFMKNYRQTNGF